MASIGLRLSLATLMALFAWGSTTALFAQGAGLKVPEPDTDEELKRFQVSPELEINLWAANPLLAKPIQMNWDAKGRLWVASSETYPHIKSGAERADKIVILEDTNNDGQADKTTVFAEGLFIPTGIAPLENACYVANSTELLLLTDTDGDGKADKREVVLSGFGTEDTHHIIHTFRWGPDGWLYFMQSIYIHSHVETPHGVERLNGGGVWRFNPRTHELQIHSRGMINPWGLAFDREGWMFGTDGAGGQGIHDMIPGVNYAATPGVKRVHSGLNPGHPKYCGLEVVGGSALPDSWQNNLLTCDFRSQRIVRFEIERAGSTFTARQLPDVLRSTHVAFRPVDIQMGPDGAIYVADWYNPIIQHGEVDFWDKRRDKDHGRIWRLTAKDKEPVAKQDLTQASDEEVIEAYMQPSEPWQQRQATRIIVDKVASDKNHYTEATARWLRSHTEDGKAHLPDRYLEYFESGRREHLLRSETALPAGKPLDVAKSVLATGTPIAKSLSLRTLADLASEFPEASQAIYPFVNDPDARVRLEAVRALARIPKPESMVEALKVLDHPMDPTLDYCLWLTANELADVWLPALERGEIAITNPAHLRFALASVERSDIIKPLLQALEGEKLSPEDRITLLELLADVGPPEALNRVLAMALQEDRRPEHRRRLLAALASAANKRRVQPTEGREKLVALIDSSDESLRPLACELAGSWKLEAAREKLTEIALATESGDNRRGPALQALVRLGGAKTLATLDKLAGEDRPLSMRQMAIRLRSDIDLAGAARQAVAMLATMEQPQPGIDDLLRAFTTKTQGPSKLVEALADVDLPPETAKVAVSVARAAPKPDDTLIKAIETAGSLVGPQPPPTPEQYAELVAMVEKASAEQGEAIYRRERLQCVKCHAIGGAGGLVGPDLTSIGASAPVDYLLASLFEPQKAVKEGYHSITLVTVEGKVLTGIVVSRTDDEVVLRDAEGVLQRVNTDDIDDEAPGRSLMPVGLVDRLTKQEVAHLTRFLSQLGKPGDYSVGRELVIRQWEALAAPPEFQRLARSGIGPDGWLQTQNSWWKPITTLVSGQLPNHELPTLSLARWQSDNSGNSSHTVATAVIHCRLTVSQAGKVGLKLNSAKGLLLMHDAKVIPLQVQDDGTARATLDLPVGEALLVWMVEPSARDQGLRVEVVDLPDSQGRATPVVGR